jgi:hypothetical protein
MDKFVILLCTVDLNGFCIILGFVYDGTGSSDRKFPLLEEVFKEFPETPINLDIKVDDDELIEKVLKVNLIFVSKDLFLYPLHTHRFFLGQIKEMLCFR